MADPEVVSDPDRLAELAREHAELEEIVTLYRQYRQARTEWEQAESLLEDRDPELRELAEARSPDYEGTWTTWKRNCAGCSSPGTPAISGM